MTSAIAALWALGAMMVLAAIMVLGRHFAFVGLTIMTLRTMSDVSQEAFIKAFNSLASFRGDSKLSVWLYRIVSNVCLDFLHSRKRRQTVSLNMDDGEGGSSELEIPDLSAMPEEELNRRLTREAVRKGLLSLPEDQREILLLREIEGLSYDEIAQALELEAGTVKSRIFRARKRLCAQLVSGGNIPDGFTSEKAKEA